MRLLISWRVARLDELPYLLDRLVIESIAASRHSAMSGTDHVATARRVLQCHVARPLTVASSYQLVVSLESLELQGRWSPTDSIRPVAVDKRRSSSLGRRERRESQRRRPSASTPAYGLSEKSRTRSLARVRHRITRLPKPGTRGPGLHKSVEHAKYHKR